MKRLWGDQFFNVKEKKWSKAKSPEPGLVRGFCQFVLDPIYKVGMVSDITHTHTHTHVHVHM